MTQNQNIVLTCDLDETLVRTDTFFEAIFSLVKSNPLLIFYFPFWILKGLPYLKNQIFSKVEIDFSSLPYNQKVLDFLYIEKSKGRKLVLVTATPQFIADKVEKHLNLFDEVYGSDDKINLKSHKKANKLVELYGEKGFDYIGDSLADINVWSKCRYSYLVAKTNYSQLKIQKTIQIKEIIDTNEQIFKSIVKEIRIYQWIKNLLLFIPLIMAHNITDVLLIKKNIAAFFAFSFIASLVYVINDIFDIDNDRKHRTKKNRPFASGKLRLQYVIILIPILIILSLFSVFLFLDFNFLLILIVYFVTTSLYSFYLKKVVLLDILILSILFTLRIFAGGIATQTTLSPWLLGFTLFLFLSLAFIKRYTELEYIKSEQKSKTTGRGYITSDIPMIQSMGISSGFISVLVLVLYFNSEDVKLLYSNPLVLWAVTPIFLYWIINIWFVASRGNMHDDPVVFAAKDKVSYIVFTLIGIILYFGL